MLKPKQISILRSGGSASTQLWNGSLSYERTSIHTLLDAQSRLRKITTASERPLCAIVAHASLALPSSLLRPSTSSASTSSSRISANGTQSYKGAPAPGSQDR